ncbi:hypothetical protein D7U89_12460 [Stenotrophomonas maltophilia]|uniref:hypothetical protein n=1 Tax=Stenotrophomonas TaxID=40323 RepID=UPI000D4F5C6D|nr:hypothetical protein [Stenotrophomonas maltophilia]MBA0226294.1 hypothetical protein [Stenotrophomonas maltophilia]MBA0367706.1 hypothetical protein [Stenotrophomonas maltophilia]MBA0405549.1 hypothetical protein [Stenotrophomonas maltophilia]MCF3497565.1 hypothetical protein [Stenotrophomonas maltophilia]MCF3522178.1 hypothetical protein [Stenotrophomonas maltophilia]
MQSWRRRQGLYLLVHSLLFSIPCALAGLLGSLLLLLGVWAQGGDNSAVLGLLAMWGVLSVTAIPPVYQLVNTWQMRGPDGLKPASPVLETLFLVSGAQAVSALVITVSSLGVHPILLILAIGWGAPWISLAYHFRWLSKACGRQ